MINKSRIDLCLIVSKFSATCWEFIFRFPDAKIIGTPASEAKLNFINALPRKKYEVNCHDKAQLFSLNSQLENEGVQLFYIDGDVATNSICAVAHGVALGKLAKNCTFGSLCSKLVFFKTDVKSITTS